MSISAAVPVKNGWHDEQVFTCISFTVERVFMTLPQAQVITAASYFGCISVFIVVLSYDFSAGAKRTTGRHGMQALILGYLLLDYVNMYYILPLELTL